MNQKEKTVIKHTISLLKRAYVVSPFMPSEVREVKLILEQLLSKGADSLIKKEE